MRDAPFRPLPQDQADGLRRLFAGSAVRFVPVLSNPHVAFGGVLLERVTSALATLERRVLVVDASERGAAPSDLASIDLAACIEPLGPRLAFLAARGLSLRHVDARGSTHGFLHALADAAPGTDVVLVHAPAGDLARMFARHAEAVTPLLLADDRPASVTHAYAGMKLLAQRARLMVFDLLLAAAPGSPRAARIAEHIAAVADQFTGAVLRGAVRIDPATGAHEAPPHALLQLARDWLAPAMPEPGVPVDLPIQPYRRAAAAVAHS